MARFALPDFLATLLLLADLALLADLPEDFFLLVFLSPLTAFRNDAFFADLFLLLIFLSAFLPEVVFSTVLPLASARSGIAQRLTENPSKIPKAQRCTKPESTFTDVFIPIISKMVNTTKHKNNHQ
ncbi:MAG: hypothetical protein KJ914_02475 [Gammaproteobacteria bacterium]|nr:hypothetical protein [Gammaproteobacteria bacterium]MBU1722586.1 hypothetical protein [Gammaproteobacteria bacterium]MBU2007058.1 hypothetical protein [Gammaproteobacteria bacterium]